LIKDSGSEREDAYRQHEKFVELHSQPPSANSAKESTAESLNLITKNARRQQELEGRNAEGRRQKSEGRGQRSEVRGQRAEGRGQSVMADDLFPDFCVLPFF
jgi:hypothetical protein